jgi:serine/threonine-protein kinase
VRRIDAACDRFETAWRAGQAPRIEDYLADAEEADRPALLGELLGLELELRRKRGDWPGRREYLDRFPTDSAIVEAAFGGRPGPDYRPAAEPHRDAACNLLLGILALQNNFVSREALLGAFAIWVADKARPLGRVLRDRGDLDDARHALLEALVAEHLKQHGGDPAASLAAVSSLGSVRADLERFADSDLQASLAAVPSRCDRAGSDAVSTVLHASPSRRGDAERFRILRFHKQGGLGRIYKARDEELGREVALKEVRPDKVAEVDLLSRFVLEAEITGGLEHPGIVPVYSLGTYVDGRPFYAMRFVEGDSLKEAIESYHREHPRPDPTAVEFRRLLGRFLDVCEAIGFAHSKGVLHRDLKPHNVMLGRYGETLLIDWGLAKATGRREPGRADAAVEATLVPPSGSGHAPTLGALGSPPYMSPEQAAGATESLGPATDVYGLGAILFAILTGKPPVEGGKTEEVLDRVRRGAIGAPRSLNPNIPRALEAICLKALSLQPQDRYATALALAKDVEHWLADEPVSVWSEPIMLRVRRWARRHRTWVTTAVATALAGLTALGAGYWRVSILNAELSDRNARLHRSQTESEQRLDQAFRAIEDYYTGVSEEVLLGQKEFADLRARLLEKPQQFYEQWTRVLDTDPHSDERARELLAKGRYDLGRICQTVGKLETAEAQYRSAITVFEGLAAAQPGLREYQHRVALCYDNLGALLKDTGNSQGAADTLRKAIAIQSELVRVEPGRREFQAGLAMSYNILGNIQWAKGELRNAAESHRQAMIIRAELSALQPDDEECQYDLATSHRNLAIVQADSGEAAASLADFERAIGINKNLVRDHPRSPKYRGALAKCSGSLGLQMVHVGRTAEAMHHYEDAKLLYDALAREQPSVIEYRVGLARDLLHIANLQDDLRQPSNALASYRRAIEVQEAIVRDYPTVPDYRSMLALVYRNLGLMQSNDGRLAEAKDSLRKARDLYRRLADQNGEILEYQFGLSTACNSLGNLLRHMRQFGEALDALGEARSTLEGLIRKSPNHPASRSRLSQTLGNIGLTLEELHRYEEARSIYLLAVDHQKVPLSKSPGIPVYVKTLAFSYAGLSRVERALGRPSAAAVVCRELRLLGSLNPDELYDVARELALCIPNARDTAEGQAWAAEAVGTLREAVAAGYNNINKIAHDPDLAPLRDRDDFRRLMAELFDRDFPADPFRTVIFAENRSLPSRPEPWPIPMVTTLVTRVDEGYVGR